MKLFDLTAAERRQLKEFGYVMGAVLSGVFGLLMPWLSGEPVDPDGHGWSLHYQNLATPMWPWLAAALFWFFALLLPIALKPIYTVWMAVGHVLGRINTGIILGILFFSVLSPMGLVMRLFGKDPLQRRLDKQLASYRAASPKPNKNHIEKPY